MTKTKPKPFSRLTAAQKRVAIAKDVIKQIHDSKLKPKIQTYWIVDGPDVYINRQSLKRNKPKCTACAVGSAILSGIRLFNQCEINAFNGGDENKIPDRWFSRDQLGLIEHAFEGHTVMGHNCGYETGDKAVEFYRQHRSAKNRLIAIFRNIIRNKGEFKP